MLLKHANMTCFFISQHSALLKKKVTISSPLDITTLVSEIIFLKIFKSNVLS